MDIKIMKRYVFATVSCRIAYMDQTLRYKRSIIHKPEHDKTSQSDVCAQR